VKYGSIIPPGFLTVKKKTGLPWKPR